ncbi:hypothetical protein ALC53_01306, partial [Atta colombica]
KMSVYESNSRHLREVLIFCFNMKKSAAEAHPMLSNTYGEAAINERDCRAVPPRKPTDRPTILDSYPHPPLSPSHPSHTRIYPSIARRVSSASIPSAATRLSFIPLDRNVRPPPMVQLSFLTFSSHSYRLSSSNSTAVSPFFSSSREICAQIRIVTPKICIRPKRNRRVEAAEILFVTRTTLADLLSTLPTTEKRMCTCLFVLVGKMARRLYDTLDRLYRYFAPPNALLPEESLQRHEHVEPHPFVVLDMVQVHDLRFCHKARNQKYHH